MNETYVECLVKKKSNPMMKFLKLLTIMLAICFVLLGMSIFWPALVLGVPLAIVAYFITMNSDIEYEYLYVDKELVVDKVMNKSKRKRLTSYDLERMEILAPIKSYRLDSYKNRTVKTTDYSSGVEQQPDVRYAMYYDGNKKIIIEPSPELIKAIQMIAPRKVFRD